MFFYFFQFIRVFAGINIIQEIAIAIFKKDPLAPLTKNLLTRKTRQHSLLKHPTFPQKQKSKNY